MPFVFFQFSAKLGKGSGFIAEIEVSRAETKIVLMTCNHVLPTKSAAQKSTFFFGRVSERKPGTTIEGKELLDANFFLTDDKEVRLIFYWMKIFSSDVSKSLYLFPVALWLAVCRLEEKI